MNFVDYIWLCVKGLAGGVLILILLTLIIGIVKGILKGDKWQLKNT